MTPYDSIFENDYYAKGLAVAESRILTDTIYARFRDEEFEWPSGQIFSLVSYDYPFPTIPIKKLRALKRRQEN